MMMLIAAAIAAAQPAPAPVPQGQMPAMQQHEGMKDDCCKHCCKDMGKHDVHAPGTQSQRGE